MLDVGPERFEALVARGLDELPDELWEQMDNVVVQIDDDPPEPGLLGLYEGVPLTDRGDYFGVLPDVIHVYRNPLLELCRSEAELVEEVRVTVLHEIAHHFGIDDDRLHELGWD